MNAKITIINNQSKKTLRQFFNTSTKKNVRDIGQITRILKMPSSKSTYTLLQQIYNDTLVKKQVRQSRNEEIVKVAIARNRKIILNNIKKAKNQIFLNQIKNYRKNKVYTFLTLEKYVVSQFSRDSPFEIKVKSITTGITHTFKFSCMRHFLNWSSRINEEHLDSAGTGQLTETEIKDIWELGFTILNMNETRGGCNKHASCEKKLKSAFYNFELHNPTSRDNNCFFACLKYFGLITETHQNMRKKFNILPNTMIDVRTAQRIIRELNLNVMVITYDINEELDENIKYLILDNNHYYAVKSFENNSQKDVKTKRGLLTFDFETRETEMYETVKISGQKQYILKDTLCKVYYKDYKKTEHDQQTFITNDKLSSARQFINWLNNQKIKNKTYNILAHNGGRFDFYFFINQLTTKELMECDIGFRGTTIISINYRGNSFRDSCCFLTDSLSNLSKSFKVEEGKITTFNLHGKTITSSQLCFYRPELKFNEFLDLQNTDPDFWELYEKYCLYDCIALYQIWEKFQECINGLISNISPSLLAVCPLMGSTTIGSHSKKIIVEINKSNKKVCKEKRGIEIFTGVEYVADAKGKFKKTIDMKKYNFLCNFKRGGISHCNKAGKHMTGITGVDIASQYPASLIYSYIPTGKSQFIDYYDEEKHGFYHLKNLKFNSYLLKPVAQAIKDQSLDWATNDMTELYVDSYMLKYIIEHYGLESYDVVEGLVSDWNISSDKIFGKYINSFYDEKKQQDEYKDSKDPEKKALYNEALRTTIKLYLNSLTGKLVENPAVHFSTSFKEDSTLLINGVGIEKTFNEDKINDWIVAGIMVYSYSKRLLFEYIRCLPENSNSVIHIETDGIYFSTKDLPVFTENLKNYVGDYPCCMGSDLGNLKIEKSTPKDQVAYFLGKKFYCITINDDYNTKPRDSGDYKNIYRVKGISQKTIHNDGSDKYLVDVKLYDDVYNWKTGDAEITRTFKTLKKNLFKFETNITSFEMTRTIRSQGGLQLYE